MDRISSPGGDRAEYLPPNASLRSGGAEDQIEQGAQDATKSIRSIPPTRAAVGAPSVIALPR